MDGVFGTDSEKIEVPRDRESTKVINLTDALRRSAKGEQATGGHSRSRRTAHALVRHASIEKASATALNLIETLILNYLVNSAFVCGLKK
jgi:non-homologous end joining protein Ku